jgi:hypothetical protein
VANSPRCLRIFRRSSSCFPEKPFPRIDEGPSYVQASQTTAAPDYAILGNNGRNRYERFRLQRTCAARLPLYGPPLLNGFFTAISLNWRKSVSAV